MIELGTFPPVPNAILWAVVLWAFVQWVDPAADTAAWLIGSAVSWAQERVRE